MRERPRIAILGATPWLAQGLAVALADEARWELVTLPRVEPADAYVVHAHAEAEANGLEAALPPDVPVLWLGAAPTEDDRQRPTASLTSDAGAEQLRAALAAVLAGLSVRVAGAAWPSRAAGPSISTGYAEETIEALTSRELEVFELLAKGLSNRDIAGVLGISAHTAKFHVAQILAKVGAATRAEAVAIGLRLGLIGL